MEAVYYVIMSNGEMNRTRLSLLYLAGYLLPTGVLLYFAPQFSMKLLFSNRQYSDAWPQFGGVCLIALGILVIHVILFGNAIWYRATLMVRMVILAGIMGIWLRSRDPFFLVVFGVVAFGVMLTGAFYLAERKWR